MMISLRISLEPGISRIGEILCGWERPIVPAQLANQRVGWYGAAPVTCIMSIFW